MKKLLFTALCAVMPAQQVLSMDSGFNVQPLMSCIINNGANLGIFGATVAGLTIMHELGHATAGYALFSSPVNIHLGSQESILSGMSGIKEPLLKLKYFTIHDYMIFTGCAEGTTPRNEIYTKKDVLVNLAGPLTGIIAALLIVKYSNNEWVKLAAITSAITNNVMNLLPIKGYDGYNALRGCGIQKNYIDKTSDIMSHPIGKIAKEITSLGAAVALLKYNSIL